MSVFDTEIKFLPGVGPKKAGLLGRELSIFTFNDLIYTFPFRYVDRSRFYTVREIDSTTAYIQLRGRIVSVSIVGKRLVANFTDGTGYIELVFFQGVKWIQERLKVGQEYVVFGKPSLFNNVFNFVHPEVDPASQESTLPSLSMTGIYSSTENLRNSIGNKAFSKLVASALERVIPYVEETLPEYILKGRRLCPLKDALKNIHFPDNPSTLQKAQERLKFEELFYLQLSMLKQKNIRMRASTGVMFKRIAEAFNTTYSKIPFPLTEAQKRVIREIRADVVSGRQMNRLLQGDVGSGKTLVAILSAMMAVDNGYQACIMAPTEVLATQHYNGISRYLEGGHVKAALLTGTTKTKERREIHQGLADGSINIIFGTHALIEESVQFANLGLAVIDEQHRFGVEQRAKLWSKSEIAPHILVMTATPIPRTLAMTLYGDLDVSVIDELPPGRKPVRTVHWTENQRGRMYEFLRSQIRSGRQVFIVYPLIKESEKMDYKNLEEGYLAITEEFQAPEFVTAVVHGKQKTENKAYDMELFASGRAHILVATSVIEVGVDVPNATVMVIESAERFGLSQLHQLRGRVGRGAGESYCILMTGYKLSAESRKRIDLMCQTTDGFALAEADMKMRGPGDFEGTRQSGLAIDLHIASLSADTPLLEEARRLASEILSADPLLEASANEILLKRLKVMKMDNKDYSNIS